VNEIRISGFGGQGIIRCGYIVGKTASLFDDKFATLTQSFGPEARGSACSAQVLVDKAPIRYPYVTVPDTVVSMSQEAYDKFGSDITDDGTLIIDEDLVKFDSPPAGGRFFSIPATRIAEQLGNRIVANIVMLGFFTAVTDILTVEAARKALPSSVPERFLDLNVKAFEQGYEYGLAVMGRLPEGGEGADRKAAPTRKKTPAAKAGKPAGATRKKTPAAKAGKPAGAKRKKAAAVKPAARAKAKKMMGKRAKGARSTGRRKK